MSLKALAKSSGGTISEMLHFPVAMIEVDPHFNVRLDTPERKQRIRELANAMLNPDVGFLRNRPLTVRMSGDQVFVVDGHTRLAAVRLANAEGAEIVRLPCLSAPSASEAVKVVKERGSRAGRVITEAVALARSEGREKAKPRDVERVQPTERPPSIITLTETFVRAWNEWDLEGPCPFDVIEAANTLTARFR